MRSFFGVVLAILILSFAVPALAESSLDRLLRSNSCKQCDLAGAVLVRAELSGANLAGANLAGADLKEVSLIGARLNGANLAGADLSGALLEGATMTETDLTGAKLPRARIGGVDFTGARGLTQGQLDAACSDFGGAPYPAKVPDGLSPRSCQ